MAAARALVITGFGLNCESETSAALQLCGAVANQVHLNDLLAQPRRLLDYHLVAFIGGFSFGDHLGAGTVFGNRVQAHLGRELREFVKDGRLVIGICNGFQTMTRMGLVPALGGRYDEQQVALAANAQGVFRDAWIELRANPASPCVFTRGVDRLALPVRHGEGRLVPRDAAVLQALEDQNLVALRYVDPATGAVATAFPHNPNGSVNAIAGLCDATGRVFGLMPHPEAYLSPWNHPHWGRQKIAGALPAHGLGRVIFQNAVDYVSRELLQSR